MKQSANTLSRIPARARTSDDTPAPFTILVPLDESELADDIRPYVRSLADAKAARIILLHVLPDLTREPSDVIARSITKAQARLRQFRKTLGARMDADIVSELRMGNAAVEILRLSVLASASMIAMPTHGRSGLKRLVTGSVAEEVLRHSRCPMLLLHSSGQGAAGKMQLLRPFSRILVAIEGTSHGDQILPFVEDLARAFHSELVLFHNGPAIDDRRESSDPEPIDRALSDIQRRLEGAGLKASVVAAHSGKTPDEIISESRKQNIDLIAMTTHGRRGLDRITFGSITEEVLRRCTRPLLVQCVIPLNPPESDSDSAS